MARLLLEAGADCSLKGTFQPVKKGSSQRHNGVNPIISDEHREVSIVSFPLSFLLSLLLLLSSIGLSFSLFPSFCSFFLCFIFVFFLSFSSILVLIFW